MTAPVDRCALRPRMKPLPRLGHARRAANGLSALWRWAFVAGFIILSAAVPPMTMRRLSDQGFTLVPTQQLELGHLTEPIHQSLVALPGASYRAARKTGREPKSRAKKHAKT